MFPAAESVQVEQDDTALSNEASYIPMRGSDPISKVMANPTIEHIQLFESISRKVLSIQKVFMKKPLNVKSSKTCQRFL